MPGTIRVFHCDDSEAFTRLVQHWLADHPEVRHVGAAHTGREALGVLPDVRPDVVLLDTMGSPGDGALMAAIRRAVPDARVIVYSGYLNLGHELLGDGADAYLEKGDDEAALVEAIHSVARGRVA